MADETLCLIMAAIAGSSDKRSREMIMHPPAPPLTCTAEVNIGWLISAEILLLPENPARGSGFSGDMSHTEALALMLIFHDTPLSGNHALDFNGAGAGIRRTA